MNLEDPGKIDFAMDRLLHDLLRRGRNRRYAERLGLKGRERVMDFGSGSGALSLHIARRLEDEGSLTLVDVSPKWMEVAMKKLRRFPNVEYKVGEVMELKIPEKSYDVVNARNVLHHVAESQRLRVMRELSRKLKKNGRLYVREPTRGNHGVPLEEMRALAEKSGLREDTVQVERDEYFAKYVK